MITMKDHFMSDHNKQYLEQLSASLNVEVPLDQEAFDEMETERDELQSQVSDLEDDLDNERDRADIESDRCTQLKDDHEHEVDELRVEIAELEELLEQRNDEIKDLKKKLASKAAKQPKTAVKAQNVVYTGLKLVGDN